MRLRRNADRDNLVLLKDVKSHNTTFHVSNPCFSNGEGLYLIEGASGAYEILELTPSNTEGCFTAARGLCGSLSLHHEAGTLLQPVHAPEEEHGTQEDARG